MRKLLTVTIMTVLSWGVIPPSATADGGLLRAWERRSAYEIAVFTTPTPVTVGSVDISVLLFDRTSSEPIQNAEIRIELMSAVHPGEIIKRAATEQTATNKLFRAATFDIPKPGRWSGSVIVDAPAETMTVPFVIDAAAPAPVWANRWVLFSWPLLVIILYGTHEWLVHRRSRRHSIRTSPPSI